MRSWPESRCAAMLSLSPSRVEPGAGRLWLAGEDCEAPSGAAQSGLARQLLSELAARLGMPCPVPLWSPRGRGRPHHADLPPGWYAGISHSKGRVIVGLADCPFGMDLERSVSRHTSRLQGLIDALPEPTVRDWIRAQKHPQAAFYQAWTLYEAQFKLTSHSANPAPDVFSTRLHNRHGSAPELMLWQGGDWTLAIASDLRSQVIPAPDQLFPELSSISFASQDLTHN